MIPRLIIIVFLFCSTTVSANDEIKSLSWLTGHWVQQKDNIVTEVMWSQPRGNSMIGTYRKIKDGEVLYYEILTMRSSLQGIEYRFDLYDRADNYTQSETTIFKVVEINNNSVRLSGRFKGTEQDANLTIEINQKGRLVGWSEFNNDPTTRRIGYDAELAPLK